MATQTNRPPPKEHANPQYVAATQTGGDLARRQQTGGQDCSCQTTSWDFWEDTGRDRWVLTSGKGPCLRLLSWLQLSCFLGMDWDK